MMNDFIRMLPVISASGFNILFTIIGSLAIISIIIFFLSSKLRKVNRELKKRNRQFEEINSDLLRANKELAAQKDLIAKEYLESDTLLKKVHEDLVKANIEAETSNKLKSSFLANISHEIRTPLNSVVGFSNLLLSNDLTSEAKTEYVEHINYNSEKLLQIIGDIIDLSRLENSQIEIIYNKASVNEIVNEVVDEARQVIRRNEKSIILNVKDHFENSDDIILTDKVWLKRVLNHLMDNAIKFTLDGIIELFYYRKNENLVFKIKDTGIGINEENLGRIFEEFRQEIDGHHRPFEGLGIGLTLAREVVQRMGGRIFVQSEKGIGSEFSFSIPYRPAKKEDIKVKGTYNHKSRL